MLGLMAVSKTTTRSMEAFICVFTPELLLFHQTVKKLAAFVLLTTAPERYCQSTWRDCRGSRVWLHVY